MTEATSEVQQELSLLERLSSTLVPELKRYISLHREEVEQMIATGAAESGLPASRRYAKIVDGVVSALFHATKTATEKTSEWHPVVLGAVGSYGRNSLSVYSDLDVRLLVENDPQDATRIAEALLYPLWDAGLSIGHQVVEVESTIELAKTDLPTATSLLDWRHLAGDVSATEVFQHTVFERVFGADGVARFVTQLAQAAQTRKERFGGSVFLLEPDLKNGAGGLRDLDLAHWAARARWRIENLGELVRVGILLPDEWADVERAIEFAVRVRNRLHFMARRRVDRLGFEQQERLCLDLGYGRGGAAVEAFMSDYYRHAREIERTSEMILRRAMPPSKQKPKEVLIGSGLKLVGDTVALEDSDLIYGEPSLVFALYEEAIHRGMEVRNSSRRAIMRAVGSKSFCQQLRLDAEASRIFRRLVCTAIQTRFKYGSVLTELHEVGLLLAMIPEFSPVVGRVHHDVYHVYTVDVHSIAAVDKLRAIYRGDLQEKLPLATRLAEEVDRPEVIFFATLLHDVGKDQGGKDHAERGAALAEKILGRLRFSEEAIGAVQHLIRKHLRMYHIATRRDLDDPRTLEGFVEDVQGTQGLRELYLLTISDVGTTSPTALNPWKRRMLDELFQATLYWFKEGDTRRGATEQIAKEVLELVPQEMEVGVVEEFLRAVPQRYLAANDPRWIVEHVQLLADAENEPARVTVLRTEGPYVELAVAAEDHPGLLSQISAALSRQKLKVIGAQVYSWVQRGRKRALDLFWVQGGVEAQAVVDAVPRLNERLQSVVSGRTDVSELVSGRQRDAQWYMRPAPPVPLQVRVDNTGASSHTIVEVITKDRSDLLFWISKTIYAAGLSIELAKIHTEGVRVTDVFYVCTSNGEKLTEPEQIEDIKIKIASTLQDLERGD